MATANASRLAPRSRTSWFSVLWTIFSDGSSSVSLAKATPSFTSSLRSLASTAIARTGAGGVSVTEAQPHACRPTNVSPVFAPSSLPKATVSPAFAVPRLVKVAPISPNTPETRPASRRGARKLAPSATLAVQEARDRHLAAMRGMKGLEHDRDRIADLLQAEPRRRLGDARRFMAQRLHQPQHAVRARGNASSTGHTAPSRNSRARSSNTRSARRLNIGEQLLQQFVVMIGELLQNGEARFLLAVAVLGRQFRSPRRPRVRGTHGRVRARDRRSPRRCRHSRSGSAVAAAECARPAATA